MVHVVMAQVYKSSYEQTNHKRDQQNVTTLKPMNDKPIAKTFCKSPVFRDQQNVDPVITEMVNLVSELQTFLKVGASHQ